MRVTKFWPFARAGAEDSGVLDDMTAHGYDRSSWDGVNVAWALVTSPSPT